jgi:phosphatidyl-myo-inositol dimannoside synthase
MGRTTSQVIVLAPSQGQGGGIERYLKTIEWAFSEQGVEYSRFDLHRQSSSGRLAAHAKMLRQSRRHIRSNKLPTRLVVGHRALLPLASLLAADDLIDGISLICHGADVWGARRARRRAEQYLMRRQAVRVVAASSFTAGTLASNCSATVLPPGLSRAWFRALSAAGAASPAWQATRTSEIIQIVTAFRLPDWRAKGLPQLLEAISALGRSDVRLTVCGSGTPSSDLQSQVSRHKFCELRPSLADGELADQLAAADIFALATRTRQGRRASGEGFGLVLLESQVAGTPVIGPAYGGSRDAYLEGVTGLTPVDETAAALARTLETLIGNPNRMFLMGQQAAAWSQERFSPDTYASQVIASLL